MDKLIPNSTQIPNILTDFVFPGIGEAELKCLIYVCRRTYGFHKERDRISLSQFINGIKGKDNKALDRGAGISRPSVVEGLRNLTGAGLIKKIATPKGNYYEINLDFTDFDEVVKKINQLRKLTKSGKESKPVQVKLFNPQKKEKQRERKVGEQSSQPYLLRKYFTDECKKLNGYEPEMSFAKEGGLLKEKLKRFKPEQIKDLIDKFLRSKVGEALGYTLSICLSAGTINQWLAGKLEKVKRPFFNGFPMVKQGNKWYVIHEGEWKPFTGQEKDIIYC